MLPRTVLATALAAVAALGVAAAPAAAKKHPAKPKAPKAQKEHRFLASFQATYNHLGPAPGRRRWQLQRPRVGVRGGGSETWTVNTRTPQRS